MKKILSAVLAAIMVISISTINAFAYDDERELGVQYSCRLDADEEKWVSIDT